MTYAYASGRRRAMIAAAVCLAAFLSGARTAGAGVTPESLTCEYLTNPLGIDVAAPRLSWVIPAGARGQRQTAYRILVATSDAKLAVTPPSV